jgi:RNA polymerase sigma-70 factor (ECF subfamily)
LNEPSDIDDLARSLLGDGEAYGRLVARYQVPIARRMRAFARQPQLIEELVQEVFVEAYYSLGRYRGDGDFGAWLSRIATRVGYRYWRRRDCSRETGYQTDWWRGIPDAPIEELGPSRAAELVCTLLDQLPPRDRLVLQLLHVDGHGIAEAARLSGWSQTRVRVQAFRARAKLRTLLAKSGVRSLAEAAEIELHATTDKRPADVHVLPENSEVNSE